MEERIRFVEYKGKQILLEDFTNVKKEDEFIALIEKAQQAVHSRPPKSVLVLVDLTNARFTTRISQVSKTAAEGNTPYVKASILVGVGGLMEIMMKAISGFSHREFMSVDTREEAMEWLIKQ